MADSEKNQGSVGLVETRIAVIDLPKPGFVLENGAFLPELRVAYETYGRLNQRRDNTIFLCHALTGSAHVAGRHDPVDDTTPWWDEMVGPGKGIDTNYYFAVCANVLGGCKGTTGPSSVNPATGKPYGSAFPRISVGDIVNAHRILLLHMGIERLAAVIGGSFGGMQALEWAIRFPDMIDRCICIASAVSLSAQALAFDIVARNAIISDPDWQGGDYYGTGRSPAKGLSQARKIGHITYLSPEMMTKKFGRERKEENADVAPDAVSGAGDFLTDFQIESYLEHQGRKLVQRFDANSYLHIARAMDEYDLAERFGTLEDAFAPIKAKMLVVALSSDWLFPPEQSVELANGLLGAGKHVSYCKLQAPHGHDAFLVDIRHLADVISAFLPWVRRDEGEKVPEIRVEQKKVLEIIRDMVRPATRILDLGCGNGDLLTMLTGTRKAAGLGVDIDLCNVIEVINKGHDVFQGNLDEGLSAIPDGSYDYAILSETLQIVHKPREILRELLRVAREGIVSFPNSAKWSHRLRLGVCGLMPRSGSLPLEWYDTPEIHLLTLRDFVNLCRRDGIAILDMIFIGDCPVDRALIRMGLRNLGADRVIVRIARTGACAANGRERRGTGSARRTAALEE